MMGTNAADFQITGGTCSGTLGAGDDCSITVTFTPGVLGPEAATLVVTDSPDVGSPHNIPFSVSNTIPDTVLPATVSFGIVAQSATRSLSTLKVTNLSPFTLTLSEMLSGTNASDFGFTSVTSCAGNTACTIPLSFTPSMETAESATLTVNVSNDPTSPHAIALNGTGTSPVRLTPSTTLSFGTVAVGTSKTLTIAVTNLGTQVLTLPTPAISGTNSADFLPATATITPCGATLAGGTTCHVAVTFKPSVASGESGSIAISASPDAASPHNVSMTGTGS